ASFPIPSRACCHGCPRWDSDRWMTLVIDRADGPSVTIAWSHVELWPCPGCPSKDDHADGHGPPSNSTLGWYCPTSYVNRLVIADHDFMPSRGIWPIMMGLMAMMHGPC